MGSGLGFVPGGGRGNGIWVGGWSHGVWVSRGYGIWVVLWVFFFPSKVQVWGGGRWERGRRRLRGVHRGGVLFSFWVFIFLFYFILNLEDLGFF